MVHIERFDTHERRPISDTTRTLLCDFAAGDMTRPLSHLDANWEDVLQHVCSNGLLGLAHTYLVHQERQDYPPPEFRQWIQQAHTTNTTRMLLVYRNIVKALAHLTKCGIDCMVVKGPALAYTVYPDPAWRSFNDLDLIVRERDWTTMHQRMLEMGFRPAAGVSPQPPPKLVPSAVAYESKYWHSETSFLVEVHYDDILNAGLASRDVEGFWERAMPMNVEGVPAKALSLEDQLIHLCAHAHYHGYTRLNSFSDIAFIVRDHAAQLNWEQLVKTVRTEEVQVAVYYTCYFLDRLLGIQAPADALSALRPDPFRRWWHERYMPQRKVLSLQPMWRPDFSFYFLPLFKRLLPDLLVMGRRREKLHYLLRLLLPPSAWLRYYYHLDKTQGVPLHYLLHPLKLMCHYLAEVVTAPAKWLRGQ
jgi:Uncharacterised nucleotidyltransferase